ncbi:MAG: trypsin-like peptidase domain-containing protein [Armatimonadota bacterium]
MKTAAYPGAVMRGARLCSMLVLAAALAALQTVPLALAPAQAQALPPELVGRIKDAVVLIDVTLTTPEMETGATGSGFVISPHGEIITNAHVVSTLIENEAGGTTVAEGRTVQVVFHPGTAQEQAYPAQVLRENHDLDLALLKIERDTPTYLELGDSDAATETSRIYACGHPLGLREISIRTGTVTAHRTWEGRRFIEHDASAEEGNSGGPVVTDQGQVVGVHTLTLVSSGMLTKFAIPSYVVSAWLATPADQDPPIPIPGRAVRELLAATDLVYEEQEDGTFAIPYDNGVTVYAHQYEDFLRLYVPLGELPGGVPLLQGYAALEALRFNYTDPVGRISLYDAGEEGRLLYWECQVPMSMASGEYLDTIALVGANQAARWSQTLAAEAPGEPTELYPGGDAEALLAQLRGHVQAAQLQFEEGDGYLKLPYDNDVIVFAQIYRGVVYTHAYTGGMPGATLAEQGQIAIELLKRNWADPIGRLSLDADNDLVWESQVPSSFINPDYFAILAATAASQVGDFLEVYGKIPFNG